MRILFVRHGQTDGNARRAYIGSTDEPLSEEGRARAESLADAFARECPGVDAVYVSPLLRARQTAAILFPGMEQHVVHDLREIDFGDFEGKTYRELEGNESYRAWVAGSCEGRCPNGEDKAGFIKRTDDAFRDLLAQAVFDGQQSLAIVAHGGTCMSVCSLYADPPAPYFAWQLGNCEGLAGLLDFTGTGEPVLHGWRRIPSASGGTRAAQG